jgi:bifunctional DNase/RNase
MSDFVEVIIDSVRISLTNQQRIVLLREVNTQLYLPIWIGPYEAESITIALQEIEIARPQTHDLLMRAIEQLNGKLLHVEIVALKGDVFYGNLAVQLGTETILIDSRPSDSLALAVRAHVPVLVSKSVLELAAISPERDMQAIIEDESDAEAAMEESGEAQKRLSVFEDFLQKVDQSNKEDQETGKDEVPPQDES